MLAVRSGILYILTAWILYKLILRIVGAERQFRTLLELSPQPFFVLEEGRWIYANPAGLDLLGAPSLNDLACCSLWGLLPSEHQERIQHRITKPGDEAKLNKHLDLTLNRLDGNELNVELLAAPLEFGGKQTMQLVLTDVTNRKRLEQELLQSEKLAAVRQLAAGVAHEIKNPLTSVLGFLQILSASSQEKQLEYIDIMRNELKRINSIVQEMLTLAKPHHEEFAVINLSSLLSQVFHFLEPESVMRNVDFQLQLDELHLPVKVTGHENRLKQVLEFPKNN